MAQTNYTPVGYWLSIPLRELPDWIVSSNGIVKVRNEKIRNEHGKKRRR